MTIDQHKIILEEILKNKPALSLIHSPNMKTYILGKVIEDLKRKHREKTHPLVNPNEIMGATQEKSTFLQ